MTDFDVMIVGAGPAGCAAAWDLCHRGHSVLLLDRHEFPRTKACAGGLTTRTLRALRYSVAPLVQRTCSQIRISLRHGKPALLAAPSTLCAMVERAEFDEYCLRQTRAAGAAFQTTRQLKAVHETTDNVTIETSAGPMTGRFLIGADGADSQVRKLSAQFQPATDAFALECQVPCDEPAAVDMTIDFGVVQRGYGWVFPKRDHLNVGLASLRWKPGELTRQKLQDYVAHRFPDTNMPKVIGHRVGIGGWDYRPASSRIFLVGDAAGMCEPLLAEGIHNAIISGQAVAAAIATNLATGASARDGFYQRMRPVWRDLGIYRNSARFVYRCPTLARIILAQPFFYKRLLRVFAAGQELASLKRFGWIS